MLNVVPVPTPSPTPRNVAPSLSLNPSSGRHLLLYSVCRLFPFTLYYATKLLTPPISPPLYTTTMNASRRAQSAALSRVSPSTLFSTTRTPAYRRLLTTPTLRSPLSSSASATPVISSTSTAPIRLTLSLQSRAFHATVLRSQQQTTDRKSVV